MYTCTLYMCTCIYMYKTTQHTTMDNTLHTLLPFMHWNTCDIQCIHVHCTHTCTLYTYMYIHVSIIRLISVDPCTCLLQAFTQASATKPHVMLLHICTNMMTTLHVHVCLIPYTCEFKAETSSTLHTALPLTRINPAVHVHMCLLQYYMYMNTHVLYMYMYIYMCKDCDY